MPSYWVDSVPYKWTLSAYLSAIFWVMPQQNIDHRPLDYFLTMNISDSQWTTYYIEDRMSSWFLGKNSLVFLRQ